MMAKRCGHKYTRKIFSQGGTEKQDFYKNVPKKIYAPVHRADVKTKTNFMKNICSDVKCMDKDIHLFSIS
jgi:hypothetical protein